MPRLNGECARFCWGVPRQMHTIALQTCAHAPSPPSWPTAVLGHQAAPQGCGWGCHFVFICRMLKMCIDDDGHCLMDVMWSCRCVEKLELTQMAKKGMHFRCPQHYCASCRKSGDGIDMVKCLRCPTAYHSSCMPKHLQRLVPPHKVGGLFRRAGCLCRAWLFAS